FYSHAVEFQDNTPDRYDPDPHMFKKLPPKISRLQDLALTLHFNNESKYLIFPDRALYHGLSVSHYVKAPTVLLPDAMHDILSRTSLVKDHVASAKRPIRLCKKDIISV